MRSIFDAQSVEDRKKQDTETCLDLLCNTLEVDCRPEDIKQIIRLGQRDRANNDSRATIIEFRSYSTKNQVMESLYKLKNANAHFRQLSVTNDMTKNESSESQKKSRGSKTEGKGREEEYIWLVRGGPGSLKVVRLRKRQ